MLLLYNHLSLHDVYGVNQILKRDRLCGLAALLLPRHLHRHILHNYSPHHPHAGPALANGDRFRHNVNASESGSGSVPPAGRSPPLNIVKQSQRLPPADPVLFPGKLRLHSGIDNPEGSGCDFGRKAGRERFQEAVSEEGAGRGVVILILAIYIFRLMVYFKGGSVLSDNY